ncbi:proton-conducting transporter transmembrane domain-containing protein [Microbacterium aurantiacum]|uniref:proton-conducting transporter transmembrane domain-containing protein n=1 Tax=Microbacterium aurantiacum TaxID=162393 RepID=UPI003F499146
MELVLIVVALAAPWVGAILAAALRPADIGARAAAWTGGIGTVAAVAAAIAAALGLTSSAGAADTLAHVMLILVLGLSALIQAYALRYLRGDLRQRWFAVWAGALTGSTAALVTAQTVVVFTLAWVAAGLSLVLLLATYRSLPQARQGVRRAAWSFAIADTPLVIAAVVVVIAAGGDVRLDDLATVAAALPDATAVALALLVVTAALGRSAQMPFHRWLPATLSAPTPVSALLHAGVVNAGAILLIRFSPLVAPAAVAMAVVFTAGAATLVYATVLRLVKTDVKGRLVHSTAGQMGFMMMAVGLGAFAAAVFHLVAHGLYKSTLFLSAGTGVAAGAEKRAWPAPSPATVRTTTAAAVLIGSALTIGVLVAGKALIAPATTPVSLALLAFLACTAIVAVAAGLRRRMSLRSVAAAAVVVATLGLSYIVAVGWFEQLIPTPAGTQAPSPWLLVIPAALLIAIELMSRSPRFAPTLSSAVYARALAASTVPTPAPGGATRPRTPSLSKEVAR